jgi:hypothetical protein
VRALSRIRLPLSFSRMDKLRSHLRTNSRAEAKLIKSPYSAHSSNTAESPAIGNPAPKKRKTSNLPEEAMSGHEYKAPGNRPADSRGLRQHVCSVAGCSRAFNNQHDLVRHERTIQVAANSSMATDALLRPAQSATRFGVVLITSRNT